MNWYVSSTLLYGFGHAVTSDYEGTKKYWNKSLAILKFNNVFELTIIGDHWQAHMAPHGKAYRAAKMQFNHHHHQNQNHPHRQGHKPCANEHHT